MKLPRLILVSDRSIVEPTDLERRLDAIRSVCPVLVQLRERDLEAPALARMAERLVGEGAAREGLSINVGDAAGRLDASKLELALRLGCGAHAPEGAALADLRRPRPWSRSIHCARSLAFAESESADYVVAGHVFATGSKPGRAPRGLPWLESMCRLAKGPVFAIGGMDAESAERAVARGAHGVAVRSGLLSCADPGRAATDYDRAMRRGLAARARVGDDSRGTG